jgi:hypothetical protein
MNLRKQILPKYLMFPFFIGIFLEPFNLVFFLLNFKIHLVVLN